MNNVTDLVHAPHIEVQETLKALQKAGVTLEDLKKIRSDPNLARAIAEIITVDKFSAIINLILPPDDQISAWLEACNRGNFGILLSEFDAIPDLPELTDQDREDGFVGIGLFYGFGGKGSKGNCSKMVLSGKIAWEYVVSQRATGKWDSIKFDDPCYLKPHDGAHSRPSGFYWKKVQLGRAYQNKSVAQVRNTLSKADWGMGPEGIQFLAITHPHFVEQMNGKDVPFMDLSDYALAPATDGNFSYAPCLNYDHGDGKLWLDRSLVDDCHFKFGSGSLR